MTDIIINKKLNRSVIVFDLDGTLIDISLRDYVVYKTIVEKSNFMSLSFQKYWMQRRSKISIFEILAQTNVPKNYYSSFILTRGKYIESESFLQLDTLFPNAIDVIEELKEKYNCYLVTSRQEIKHTKTQLAYLGFDKVFSASNCYITQKKDKNEIFQKIKKIEFVVGDTENDIIPAKELNKISIAVCSGIRNENYLKELSPSYIIPNISSLKNILNCQYCTTKNNFL
jgi:phosphoglycolate phosphatase